MEEKEMGASRKEGVYRAEVEKYVWGPMLAGTRNNYKSISICGESFTPGDCVRCPFESHDGHVGKIMRLSQAGDRKMCKVRRFYSYFQLPPPVRGLDYLPEAKERFLASGEGPGVDEDIPVEEIAGRCVMLCTENCEYNEMPSDGQLEAADYFFQKGYDPASKEVVGLEGVVDCIGVQKVYNKKEWLLGTGVGRSSSQISASRVLAQSTASGASSHQGATETLQSSIPEVSPAPFTDSVALKMKKRKTDDLTPELQEVDVVEKKNEVHTSKKPKVDLPKVDDVGEKKEVHTSKKPKVDLPKVDVGEKKKEVHTSKRPKVDLPNVDVVEEKNEVHTSKKPKVDLPNVDVVEEKNEVHTSKKPKVDLPNVDVVEEKNEVHTSKKPKVDVPKVDVLERKNEVHSPKKPKVEKNTLVMALTAPALTIPQKKQHEVSHASTKRPSPVNSKSEEVRREEKGGKLKNLSSPVALSGSTQGETAGGVTERQKKIGDTSTVSSGREMPSNIRRKSDDGINVASSHVNRDSKVGGTKKSGGLSVLNKTNAHANTGLQRDDKASRMHALSIADPSISTRKIPNLHTEASSGTKRVGGSVTETLKAAKAAKAAKTLKALDVNPGSINIGTYASGASPRIPKEMAKTDFGGRVLIRDEGTVHASGSTPRQAGSQALDMSARKGNLSLVKEPSRPGLSPLVSPRAPLSKLQTDRDIGRNIDVSSLFGQSPTGGAQQKPQGQIFKPKVEDWDSTIVMAIQNRRVLLLKNVDPEFYSDDLAEALTEALKIKCELRIAPPVSFSYLTTTALLKLPSSKKADEVLQTLDISCLIVGNRPVIATRLEYSDFKKSQNDAEYFGHLDFAQTRDYFNDDYKNAVATSHLAQGNTIEFAYGLPWRVLDDQHQLQWHMLQTRHLEEINGESLQKKGKEKSKAR